MYKELLEKYLAEHEKDFFIDMRQTVVSELTRFVAYLEADFIPYFEWTCPACGMRLPSTQTHCPNDHGANGLC
jgi:hypothetical protein